MVKKESGRMPIPPAVHNQHLNERASQWHRICLITAVCSLLLVSASNSVVAQRATIADTASQKSGNNDIKGFVIDATSGEALPYANILLKGTSRGTTNNTSGYFVLVDAPARTCTLLVSYIGYLSQDVIVENARGQTEPLRIRMKPSTIELEGVTVTAEQYQVWKKAEEVSQITFSARQVASLPSLGEVDIFRSLQLLPGISAASDASSGLYVRGGTPDQNLVILDGMTVYHVDHFFGFFSAFNADAVKDIQVYKGGFPARYGGRLSSVVELTGKTGDASRTRLGIGVNLLSANAVAEGPLFGKASWLVSVRRSYSDIIESSLYNKFYDFITGGSGSSRTNFAGPGGGSPAGGGFFQQEESRPSFYFYDLNGRLSFSLSSEDIVALSLYSGKDNLDQSQQIQGVTLRSDTTQTAGTRENQDITDWGNLGASVKWSRQWGDRFYSNVLLARSSYFSEHSQNQSFGNLSSTSDSSRGLQGMGAFGMNEDNRVTDLSFRVDNELHASSDQRIEFGTWITQTKTRYVASLNDTTNLLNENTKAFQAAFYLQDSWKLIETLNLNLGLRETYFDQTRSFYFEPRASVAYQLTDRIKLNAAWGEYYQFVHQITNESVLDRSRDLWLVASKSIRPSSASHDILGLSYETDDYLFDVEAYLKNMKGLVELSQRYENRADYNGMFFFGTGTARGIEFLAQKKRGAFNGWISYTLGKVEYTFPNLNDGKSFPADHDRRHEVKAVATYAIAAWNFSADWVFSTGNPYTSPQSQYFLTLLDGTEQSYIHVGEKNAYRLPAYQRLDVSVSRRFFEERSYDWEIGISIFNVTNHKNVWYRKYDLQVTPIVVTDVVNLGITPTVYVKVRF
jgi:hypothetical protein